MTDTQKDLLQVIALSFTNRCNLNCTHCGYDFTNKDVSKELQVSFFEKVLKEAKILGAQNLNITGGEIFLRPDIIEMIDKAVKLGYFVSLESNGTIITEDQIKALSDFGSQIRIAISLDGMTEKVHETVRGKNTFMRTIQTLENISKAQIPARINTVLQNCNIDDIIGLVKYAVNDLQIGFRLLPFILQHGKGLCACKNDGVDFYRIKELLDGFYYPLIREKNHSDNLTIGLNVALVPIDITGHLICPWGQSMLGIGPNGIVSLCHVSNDDTGFIFGDLKKQSIADIWGANVLLKQFREFDPNILKGVCGNCLAREICRGGCRLNAISSYQGDFLAPDSQCQTVYDLNEFETEYLEDPAKDCQYF